MKNFKTVLLAGLILIITFSAFLPCLKNGFLSWDDYEYVVDNTLIQHLSLGNIKQIFSSFFIGNYQPFTMFSYLLEYKLFKLDAFGYHLTSIILHLLNTLFVFWLIYLLTRAISISSITAVLFGIHPLHVESVAWISQRKDLLYALFFLAAIICYCYYLRKQRHDKYYYLSLIFFILSLLSKAMAITLPLVLILVDYLFHRKVDKRMVIDKIPFFLLSFIFCILAVFGQSSSGFIRNEVFGFLEKTVLAGYDIIFYLNKILLPTKLSCFYPYYGVKDISRFLYPLTTFMILFIAVILSARHTRKVVFGSAFFLITLLPVLQFIPIGGTAVADRYVYIPSLGVFYLMACGFSWLYARKTKHLRLLKSSLLVLLIVVIFVLVSFTWKRCQVWKDSITLWSDVLKNHPDVLAAYSNAEAYNNQGVINYSQGNLAQAILDLNKAIQLNPNYAEAYNNRGAVYIRQGNVTQAILDLNKAIQLNPNYADAYNNRGLVYNARGDFDQAIVDYNKAIQLKPNQAQAYSNRAMIYFKKREYDKSREDVNKAEALGYKISPAFLRNLKNSSGRER